MIGIYKITNLINSKSYIGQSVDIQKRFNAHKNAAINPKNKNYNYPLYRAIRKYGIENFSFNVVEECSVEQLNDKEIYYIEQYDSYNNGYNQDKGGKYASHYLKLSDDLVTQIIFRLKTSLDNSDEIGEEFGVSGRTVRGINSGEHCHMDNETYPIRPALFTLEENIDDIYVYKIKPNVHTCQQCGAPVTKEGNYCIDCSHKLQRKVSRPEPLELAKMIKENGFEGTGQQYGVNGNTIKKWCEMYGIPYLKKQVVNWYNTQMGIQDEAIMQPVKKSLKKKVKQIDPVSGDVMNIFDSTNEAARFLGKTKGSHIGEVCNGISQMAYGYRWEFCNDEIID